MSGKTCTQNFSPEICERQYFENNGREKSVILKVVLNKKAGRLLNSVILFRLAMGDGPQLTW
jgi:hypothetical protein